MEDSKATQTAIPGFIGFCFTNGFLAGKVFIENNIVHSGPKVRATNEMATFQ